MIDTAAVIASRVRLDPVCEHRDASGYCRRLSVSAVPVPGGDPANLTDYRARCDRHAIPGLPRYCTSCHGPLDTDGLTCRGCAERSAWQPATPRTEGGTSR